MAFGISSIFNSIKERLIGKKQPYSEQPISENTKSDEQLLERATSIEKKTNEDAIIAPAQIGQEEEIKDEEPATIVDETDSSDTAIEESENEEQESSDYSNWADNAIKITAEEINAEIEQQAASILAGDALNDFSQGQEHYLSEESIESPEKTNNINDRDKSASEDEEQIDDSIAKEQSLNLSDLKHEPDIQSLEQEKAEETITADEQESYLLAEQQGELIYQDVLDYERESEDEMEELDKEDNEYGFTEERPLDKEAGLLCDKKQLEERQTEYSPKNDSGQDRLEDKQTLTFAEKYHIDVEKITDMPISYFENLPVRIKNVLHRANKHTLKKFLLMTSEELLSRKNVGYTSMQAVDKFFEAYAKEYKRIYHIDETVSANERHSGITELVKKNLEKVKEDDWSFLSKEEQELYSEDIVEVKAAKEDLGSDLISVCLERPAYLASIYGMLDEFCAPYMHTLTRMEKMNKLLAHIPRERQSQLIKPYISAYSHSASQARSLEIYDTNDIVQGYFRKATESSTDADWEGVCTFAVWMSFNLAEEIASVEQNTFTNDRQKTILALRSNGCTLEETGAELNLTRERVRQIEAKVKEQRFFKLIEAKRICEKIYAVSGMKPYLSEEELESYFSKYKKECVYMLKGAEELLYRYDTESGVFYNVNYLSDSREVDRVLELLPEIMWDSEIEDFLEKAEGYDSLNKECVKERFANKYRKSGELYHLRRLRRTDIYQLILGRFYPDGIMIYDHEELERFRKLTKEHVGVDDLPTEDRALEAGITRICILCGKGKYKLRQDKYIPTRLINDIERYILNQDGKILFIGAVYEEFENRLSKYGVDNRFYFQGILKQCQSGKIYMTKDYVSSQPMELTVVDSIVEYIRDCGTITSKEKIEQKYKGLGPVIYGLVSSHHKIINMFGQYLHVDNVKETEAEKRLIGKIIKKYVFEGQGYIHGKDLMPVFEECVPVFLTRNGINYAYQLVSVLGALYNETCVVRRPFIAKKGAVINRPKEQLDEVIKNDDVIDISTIKEAAAELHYSMLNILDFIGGYENSHLLINSKQIASYSYIGINQAIMSQVVKAFEKVVHRTTPINDLSIVGELPQLNVPWNEWLVFSIIRHASDALEVASSSPQMRESVAVIAPKGRMIITPEIAALRPNEEGNLAMVDNLDNIDDLIEEFIDEEIEF